MLARKLGADTLRNSLTGSHLRDTGRGRFGSTRLHRRRRPVAKAPHREKHSSEGPVWDYGVFGKQRDERLCGKEHLYICEEANRQVPPMLFRWHL
jgi:hypothetical protein